MKSLGYLLNLAHKKEHRSSCNPSAGAVSKNHRLFRQSSKDYGADVDVAATQSRTHHWDSVVAVHRFAHRVVVWDEVVWVKTRSAREWVEVNGGYKLLHKLEGSNAAGARLGRRALECQVRLARSEGGAAGTSKLENSVRSETG